MTGIFHPTQSRTAQPGAAPSSTPFTNRLRGNITKPTTAAMHPATHEAIPNAPRLNGIAEAKTDNIVSRAAKIPDELATAVLDYMPIKEIVAHRTISPYTDKAATTAIAEKLKRAGVPGKDYDALTKNATDFIPEAKTLKARHTNYRSDIKQQALTSARGDVSYIPLSERTGNINGLRQLFSDQKILARCTVSVRTLSGHSQNMGLNLKKNNLKVKVPIAQYQENIARQLASLANSDIKAPAKRSLEKQLKNIMETMAGLVQENFDVAMVHYLPNVPSAPNQPSCYENFMHQIKQPLIDNHTVKLKGVGRDQGIPVAVDLKNTDIAYSADLTDLIEGAHRADIAINQQLEASMNTIREL